MRVYHFLATDNALDDLKNRRVKLSKIDDLNDPFELSCMAQRDRRVRKALRRFRTKMAQHYGMLCFSKNWHNTVLWSHYATKHRGVCLGFDVDDQYLRPVSYVAERPDLQIPPTEETAQHLLFTKYCDWSYEEEVRGWFRLETRDPSTGFYFYNFDEKVQLSEIIAGPLCDTSRTDIDAALEGNQGHIRVIKARLAFNTFRVVENRQGFRR